MLGLGPWLSLVAVILAAMVARLVPRSAAGHIARRLEHRALPLVVGVATAVAVGMVWGSLSRSAVISDEAAYLLQARLFAHFHWTAAGRPLPEFFEQMQVFVTPVLASMYPPGTSLSLTPGIWLGIPGLMIVVMNGLTGALVFVLARRMAGAAVALVAWLFWITAYPVLYFHSMYLSEVPSGLAWLIAWWGLWHWKEDGGRQWLVLAAAAVGFCLITRPLTGLALAVVVSVVTLTAAKHRGSGEAWRDLAAAGAVGLLVVALVPLWSWRTIGTVRLTPESAYVRTYRPFDGLGFGAASTAPLRRPPPDQASVSDAFRVEHAEHTLRALPRIAVNRAARIGFDMWYEWRGGALLFALIGLLTLPLAARIALAAFALQFVLYLGYAHPLQWSIYYTEGAPLLAFMTASGIARACAFIAVARTSRTKARGDPAADAEPAAPASSREPSTVSATPALALLALALLLPAGVTCRQIRAQIAADHSYYDQFRALIARSPAARQLVFVRYAPGHNDDLSLVRNEPNLTNARAWTVYDRGADDARLVAVAPDRVPFLYDERSAVLRPLTVPAPPKVSAIGDSAGGGARP